MNEGPLFESNGGGDHLCLLCGKAKSSFMLRESFHLEAVMPLCSGCVTDWRAYGNLIFKRIQPLKLTWTLLKFKLRHPITAPKYSSVASDMTRMIQWVRKATRCS